MKTIVIVGGNGSIGNRYKTILSRSGLAPLVIEQDTSDKEKQLIAERADGFIIATPTPTHVQQVFNYGEFKKPILCEKPISTDLDEVKKVLDFVAMEKIPFQLVNQYQQITRVEGLIGDITVYDYFKHGNDGLLWDCISIIAEAKNQIVLREISPIWEAKINGYNLTQREVEVSYATMLTNWLNKKPIDYSNLGTILAAHEKVEAMGREGEKQTDEDGYTSYHWDPGTKYEP